MTDEAYIVPVYGDYPSVERVITGLYSFDRAMMNQGKLGMPLRAMYEIYGNPGVGKTTFAYFLSGCIRPTGTILIAPIESLDKEYISRSVGASGFIGEVRLVDVVDEKGKMRDHEDQLDDLAAAILDNTTNATVLDSIGAIIPKAEKEGDIGEAFVGQRARVVAKYARKTSYWLPQSDMPKCAFVCNHVHGIIGGRGHASAGGDTLKYLSRTRIYLWSEKITSGDEIIGYHIHGKTEKHTYGGQGKSFNLVNILGYGISRELTAVFDCVDLGVAERKATVKYNDPHTGETKSVGYLSKLFDAAREGRPTLFEPFFDLIERNANENKMAQGK